MHIAINQIIQHDVLYARYINPHHLSNKQARTIWLVLSDWTIYLKRSPTISSWKEHQTENPGGPCHIATLFLHELLQRGLCLPSNWTSRRANILQQMNCKWHTRKESPAQNLLQAIDDNSKSLCTKACGNIAAVLDWLAATGKNLTDWGKSLLTRSAA